MTEDEFDVVCERKEQISRAVDELVNKMISDLTPEQALEVRIQLTEQYRFWG